MLHVEQQLQALQLTEQEHHQTAAAATTQMIQQLKDEKVSMETESSEEQVQRALPPCTAAVQLGQCGCLWYRHSTTGVGTGSTALQGVASV
jgi:hypothetical protein